MEHFFHISDAMTYHSGSEEKSLWDSGDNFFYDSISWPGGHTQRLKTRSLGMDMDMDMKAMSTYRSLSLSGTNNVY